MPAYVRLGPPRSSEGVEFFAAVEPILEDLRRRLAAERRHDEHDVALAAMIVALASDIDC